MYCGDETGAFIGDIGSCSSRFGYGGEDNPKYVVPSYVGGNNNDDENQTNKLTTVTSCYHDRYDNVTPVYRMADSTTSLVDPTSYLQQGDCVESWDAYEELWQGALDVLRARDLHKHTTGRTNGGYSENAADVAVSSETIQAATITRDAPCGHPLLAVSHGNTYQVQTNGDSSNTSLQYQASCRRDELIKTTEILLETLQAPACFVAPTPMLDAFSHGRQTCLVVDIGAGGTRVTPILDGLLLKNAQRRSGRGGDWLSQIQLHALQQYGNIDVKPRYQVSRQAPKSTSPAFHHWAMLDVMYEFRTSHHVVLEPWRKDEDVGMPFANPAKVNLSQKSENQDDCYELPDGTMVDLSSSALGQDLCRVPELYFSDKVPFVDSPNSSILNQSDTLSTLPLHKLVQASLTAVGDQTIRKELCGNVVLCGAGYLVENLDKRLSYELSNTIPSNFKCRVISSRSTTERSCAAWIGGSVLTSLGSFQQLWLSKKEYEEYGATLATNRFPM